MLQLGSAPLTPTGSSGFYLCLSSSPCSLRRHTGFFLCNSHLFTDTRAYACAHACAHAYTVAGKLLLPDEAYPDPCALLLANLPSLTQTRLLLLFSCQVVSDSLWPHGLQHARLSCPSLSPGVCSNSCPLSRWCHPTIPSSVASFSSCPVFPSIRVFSSKSAFHIRWPKYGNLSISPSSE